MAGHEDTLEVYVRYDPYLSANQLIDLVVQLDRMYNALYCGIVDCDVRDMQPQSRMRIAHVNTGNSISLELIEGIAALASTASPLIKIPAGLGIMSLAAKLLVSCAKGVAEVRKTWYDGDKARADARKANAEGKKYEAESVPEKPQEGHESKSAFSSDDRLPMEAKKVANDAAIQIINFVEYSVNLTILQVNGKVLVEKGEQ